MRDDGTMGSMDFTKFYNTLCHFLVSVLLLLVIVTVFTVCKQTNCVQSKMSTLNYSS